MKPVFLYSVYEFFVFAFNGNIIADKYKKNTDFFEYLMKLQPSIFHDKAIKFFNFKGFTGFNLFESSDEHGNTVYSYYYDKDKNNYMSRYILFDTITEYAFYPEFMKADAIYNLRLKTYYTVFYILEEEYFKNNKYITMNNIDNSPNKFLLPVDEPLTFENLKAHIRDLKPIHAIVFFPGINPNTYDIYTVDVNILRPALSIASNIERFNESLKEHLIPVQNDNS